MHERVYAGHEMACDQSNGVIRGKNVEMEFLCKRAWFDYQI